MANIKIIPARDMQPAVLRVAAYCRVSSDSSDQLHSYAVQIRAYTEMIRQHENWELVDIYADAGLTGTKTDKRDALNRMMEDCRKGKIDRILVKSVSRFARNTKDCLVALRELSLLGVSVEFEEDHIDTATLTMEMMVSIFGSLAQQESMSISQNQRISYQRRMERGEFISCVRMYGYKLVQGKRLEIEPEEAKWVRWIFDAYLNGKSVDEIGQELREKNVPNRDNRIAWNESHIRYLLANEKYIGDSLCQKTYREEFPYIKHYNNGQREKYYVEGSHPAIISRETFEKAQALRDQRNIPNLSPYSDSMFSRKIRCGVCGSAFCKKVQTGGKAVWICRKHLHKADACPVKRISEDGVRDAFVRMLKKLRQYEDIIFAPALTQLQDLSEAMHRGDTEVARLNLEIADTAEKAHKLRSLQTAGIISEDVCTARAIVINTELNRLRDARRKLLQNEEIDLAMEKIKNTIDLLRERPEPLDTFDEELYLSLVDHIVVESSGGLQFHLHGGMIIPQRMEAGL